MLGRLVPDFLTDQFDGTSGLVGWVGSIMAGHFGGPEGQPVQIWYRAEKEVFSPLQVCGSSHFLKWKQMLDNEVFCSNQV